MAAAVLGPAGHRGRSWRWPRTAPGACTRKLGVTSINYTVDQKYNGTDRSRRPGRRSRPSPSSPPCRRASRSARPINATSPKSFPVGSFTDCQGREVLDTTYSAAQLHGRRLRSTCARPPRTRSTPTSSSSSGGPGSARPCRPPSPSGSRTALGKRPGQVASFTLGTIDVVAADHGGGVRHAGGAAGCAATRGPIAVDHDPRAARRSRCPRQALRAGHRQRGRRRRHEPPGRRHRRSVPRAHRRPDVASGAPPPARPAPPTTTRRSGSAATPASSPGRCGSATSAAATKYPMHNVTINGTYYPEVFGRNVPGPDLEARSWSRPSRTCPSRSSRPSTRRSSTASPCQVPDVTGLDRPRRVHPARRHRAHAGDRASSASPRPSRPAGSPTPTRGPAPR